MKKHNHCKCEHNLKYCQICDMVYCSDCKKEWSVYYSPYTTSSTLTIPNFSSNPTCEHLHKESSNGK